MPQYLKLVLIRHGESQGNTRGCLEGQQSTPLSAKGQQQAQQLATYLQNQPRPTQLYSSPLQRAMQTAQYLASMVGCLLQLDPNLQELHPGVFQGLTWAEASEQYPQLCAALIETVDYRPIPGAESPTASYQRACDWYQCLWQRHGPGEVIWVVSHGGFMQQLIRVILGCDRSWQISIHHTGLFEFWVLSPELTPSSQHNPEYRKIIKFNDISHLSLTENQT
ncbi:MAG: histidine phosphatase family protein [Leptolyngbyaceae cyanobacterium]